jgi:predicted glycoside hydrolase/deacetylase ChbG (UPF0249 family)
VAVIVPGLLLAASLQATAQAPARTVQERLGHPATARLLVIHADDFGMSHSVNRATGEALEKGWITSASILVPCPWFPEAARWAKAHPEADLGIHLALNSEWTGFRWGPLSDGVPSLLDPDGYLPLVETTVAARAKAPEVERELRAQIQKAQQAGIRLTHFDSHMGALFQTAPLFEVYRKMGTEFGLPVLADRANRPPAGASMPDADVLLDKVVSLEPGVPPEGWRAAYEKLLTPLPPGVYELIVHLATDDEEMRGATADHPDWGARWRQLDFDLVRDPGFRDYLKGQGFVLVTWKDLARARP